MQRTDQHPPPPENKIQTTQSSEPPSVRINCLDDESDDNQIEQVPKFSVIDIPLSVRAQAFLSPTFSPMPMMPCPPHNDELDEEKAKESPAVSNNALVLYSPQSFGIEDKASSMDID
ncbi:hypothetical protein GGI23_001070 [Coemansia sp. RSA 2559]|nr:hypothetical protein GGI23_001070 [Coemansia sp. RSA 2559]KAJ2863963.1 hypothetical protein GGI22_001830 [Coemansia erecta]